MKPPPDMFELKQVAAIPKLEKRHELMLSIIEERLANHERYRSERIPRYSWDESVGLQTKENVSSMPFALMSEKVIMKGCQHKNRRDTVAAQREALYTEQRTADTQMRQEESERRAQGRGREYLERRNIWANYFARLKDKGEDILSDELTRTFYDLKPKPTLKQLASILNEEDPLKRMEYMQQTIESRSK
jgi:hypothetical protein